MTAPCLSQLHGSSRPSMRDVVKVLMNKFGHSGSFATSTDEESSSGNVPVVSRKAKIHGESSQELSFSKYAEACSW